MADAPSRYWVIRHPASGTPKETVAQFDTAGGTTTPDEIADYDEFQIQSLSGRSGLTDNIDQSGLSDEEKELLSNVYPILE